jgi:predicted phage baseplate assembly protein
VAPDTSPEGTAWRPRRDLLDSGADDCDFVVEVDEAGRPHLRFGDGNLGQEPAVGTAFEARYRVGNGTDGNVGAESIALAVTEDVVDGVTLSPRNPLPARGGTPPEPIEEVKQFAPHAFRRRIVRAVTAADYAHLATEHPAIQRAAAELRWNGSWMEARVAVDPLGRTDVPASLLDEIKAHLFPYRRIGHDLDVRPAEYVFVDLALEVCVAPAFLRGHVQAALQDRFSTRRLPDGSLGFFHPDALTFGDSLSLSRIVAAAQAVTGVDSVRVTRLERLFEGPNGEIAAGELPIGPLEVARLDNDPSFPEHGRIQFNLRGGR